MKHHIEYASMIPTFALVFLAFSGVTAGQSAGQSPTTADLTVEKSVQRTLIEGRQIFRFDTFGDESFWGDTIKLQRGGSAC